ncbi:uncharacterized protein LOC110455854 isoform X2 [Mizuhopecten yessoensis]|uniref:Transmembrane protein 272 n=1 Tax=Mizuhopecten yessoensis TaxID=6573 RepID=A0A210R437_MIZYE|nr:uncharacterized protein LOC110455854 isoform X2 [Mizuhopecten yessoensis]OWF55767.1 hypothetical protein KP79_PYT23834 [Mizuhopecten yessoensis]
MDLPVTPGWNKVNKMLEPPPYSPHPAGTSIVTTPNNISPPPEYLSAVLQGVHVPPVNNVPPPSHHYLPDNNEGIHVVSSDVLPPVPDYRREAGSEPPPSYESLFGRVKAAQQSSNSSFALCSKLCGVFLSSAFCLIVMAVLSALPVAEIVIGAVYINDCPVAKYVPVYLVVIGAACLVKFLSILGQNIHNRQFENEEGHIKRTNGFDQVLNVFLLVWFILGNRWVYGTHSVWVSDPLSANYCHPTLYYFAYWSITSFYIFCGAACVCICILSCICGHSKGQT